MGCSEFDEMVLFLDPCLNSTFSHDIFFLLIYLKQTKNNTSGSAKYFFNFKGPF